MEFAAAHHDEHEGDPICAALRGKAAQIAPSMTRAHLIPQRTESARVVRDREMLAEIRKIHSDNLGVYGARKVHSSLKRKGMSVARCNLERLMKADGLQGIPQLKGRKTTHSNGLRLRSRQFGVQRQFVADAPNTLWVGRSDLLARIRGGCTPSSSSKFTSPDSIPKTGQNMRVRWAEALPRPSSGAHCRWGIHHGAGDGRDLNLRQEPAVDDMSEDRFAALAEVLIERTRTKTTAGSASGTAAPVMACTIPSPATDSSPRQDNYHIHGVRRDAVRTLGVRTEPAVPPDRAWFIPTDVDLMATWNSAASIHTSMRIGVIRMWRPTCAVPVAVPNLTS